MTNLGFRQENPIRYDTENSQHFL